MAFNPGRVEESNHRFFRSVKQVKKSHRLNLQSNFLVDFSAQSILDRLARPHFAAGECP